MELRLASRLALGLGLVAWGLHVLAFADAKPSPEPLGQFDAVVVFSGDHGRIAAGLDFLIGGKAERLFVSGVNPNAGLRLETFAAQFGRGRRDVERLIACCVALGEGAETTLQNGVESACWMARGRVTGPVLLVTSVHHMPRARAALAAFTTASPIVSYRVAPARARVAPRAFARALAAEYVKWLASAAILPLPRGWFPSLYGSFAVGCGL